MTVNTNVGPQYQLTFAYDAKGRRIQKIVATNGVALSTNNFIYDGWNLVAETRPDNSLIRSYVWGTDLSGTSQGAGGVGGLLEISYYGSSTTNCFPEYDGNGNVMALVNAADGTVVANYDYAAFGEPIRITGVMARNNPFRFSTKYADEESDLLYYGYRYYKPSTGTWLSRDPIGEPGFEQFRKRRGFSRGHIYSLSGNFIFCHNEPISYFDILGLVDDREWPSGRLTDPATLKQLLDAMQNWMDRLRDYLDCSEKNKNDEGHFKKLGEKCKSAKLILDRFSGALANPNIDPDTRALMEAVRDTLKDAFDSFCPPDDKLPKPCPKVISEPIPVPVPVPKPNPNCCVCPSKEQVQKAATVTTFGGVLIWIGANWEWLIIAPAL